MGKYIVNALIGICLMIDNIIVNLNSYLFELFLGLTRIQFENSAIFDKIATRLYVIIGIFMVFRVTFSLIQMLVNPDMMSDKEKGLGKLATRIVVSLTLLVLTPFIFEKAIEIQNVVLEENIIGQLVLGANTDVGTTDESVKTQGHNLAFQVFKGFVSPNEDADQNDEIYIKCKEEYEKANSISQLEYADGYKISCFTDFTSNDERPFSYLLLVSTIGSLILAWMVVGFCIDIATRLIKLGFYQIIAPIPIISYINADKNGPFNTWVKKCISTYISVFVKLLIIYFVIYMCNIITQSGINFESAFGSNHSTGVINLAKVAVILGLIVFAKSAPKLIKDMFGIKDDDDGGFTKSLAKAALLGGAGMMAAGASNLAYGATGFKTGVKNAATNFKNANGWAKFGAGLGVLGAVANPLTSGIAGAASGLRRGAQTGYAGKSMNPFAGFGGVVRATNLARNQRDDLYGTGNGRAGYSVFGNIMDTARSTIGMRPDNIKSRIDEAKGRANALQAQMASVQQGKDSLHLDATQLANVNHYTYDGFKKSWRVDGVLTDTAPDFSTMSADEQAYLSFEEQRGNLERENVFNSKAMGILEQQLNSIEGKTGNKSS